MKSAIHLITLILDIYIIVIYLNRFLGNRKSKISFPIFLGNIFLIEIILGLNQFICISTSFRYAQLCTYLVSFSTIFGLCFLYDCTIKQRLLAAIYFQVCIGAGEILFSMLMINLYPSLMDYPADNLYALMNLGSEITALPIILFSSAIWNKLLRTYPIQYHLLQFSTPLISLAILLALPDKQFIIYAGNTFLITLCFGLALLNIINYVLQEAFFHNISLNYANKQLTRQISYQNDKYIQINASYRQTRSILHDTKKHYLALQGYIDQKQYDQLSVYLTTALSDIQNTYTLFNTGNIVIDSMLSNYKILANQHNIDFISEINVSVDCIPLSDYDLCIILGNLLDNAINACLLTQQDKCFIKIRIITTDDHNFCLFVKNSYSPAAKQKDTGTNLEHGYGIQNIKNIVNNYYGIMRITKNNFYKTDILIPIISLEETTEGQ